jgi:hypothetical protein
MGVALWQVTNFWKQYHKTYNKEITPRFTKKDSIISDSDTKFRYEYVKCPLGFLY